MRVLLTIIFFSLTASIVSAQPNEMTGLPIRLGDSIEKVKNALATNLDPEEIPSTTLLRSSKKEKKHQLRLKTKGITVQFDGSDKVYAIRLEVPFAGNINGVGIGKSRNFLVEKMGKPVKILKEPFALNEPYIYYTDDITTVRFVFNQDDEIDIINIEK